MRRYVRQLRLLGSVRRLRVVSSGFVLILTWLFATIPGHVARLPTIIAYELLRGRCAGEIISRRTLLELPIRSEGSLLLWTVLGILL